MIAALQVTPVLANQGQLNEAVAVAEAMMPFVTRCLHNRATYTHAIAMVKYFLGPSLQWFNKPDGIHRHRLDDATSLLLLRELQLLPSTIMQLDYSSYFVVMSELLVREETVAAESLVAKYVAMLAGADTALALAIVKLLEHVAAKLVNVKHLLNDSFVDASVELIANSRDDSLAKTYATLICHLQA